MIVRPLMYLHTCSINNYTNCYDPRIHRMNPLASMYCTYCSMHGLFCGSSSQIVKFKMYEGQSIHIDYETILNTYSSAVVAMLCLVYRHIIQLVTVYIPLTKKILPLI